MTGFKTPLHGRTHLPMGSDPIAGGGFIRFDTSPQDGNWLYVQSEDATAVGGSPNGYGIELNDNSAGGAFMGAFGGGDVRLSVSGGGAIYLESADDISLAATDVLRLGTFGNVFITSTSATITLDNAGSGFGQEFDGDSFLFTGAAATASFAVDVTQAVILDSGYGDIGIESTELKLTTLTTPIRLTAQGGANIEIWPTSGDTIIKSITPGSPGTAIPILKVTHGTAGAAPTYHIATGAAWVADL